MKAIVLAAGYATRLYPITKNFPKPLLEIGGKTILDYLINQIRKIPDIDEVHLVSNSRFVGHFQEWLTKLDDQAEDEAGDHHGLRIKIHNDGTSSAEDRIGAIRDLLVPIDAENLNDDLLVTASDNILQWSLNDLVKTWKRNGEFHICVRHEEDREDLKKRGNAILDNDDRLVNFVEKPQDPKSNWVVPPIYIYPKPSLPVINDYLEDTTIETHGIRGDSPGQIVEWLYTRIPVYAHKIDGEILDIGNPSSLAQARAMMRGPS